jgi:hypothetical protein
MHGGRQESAAEMMQPFVPWPTMREPDDIAGAALFLAGDDAGFVTGHAMVVDGGLTAAGPGITRRGGLRVPPKGFVGIDRGSTGQEFLVRQRPARRRVRRLPSAFMPV